MNDENDTRENSEQLPSMAAIMALPHPMVSVTTPDNTTTRPSPPSRTRSSSLLHRNVLSRMRPLPFQYVFSFWHTKSISSSRPTLLGESVPDIAAFYKIYNNFPWESLALKDSVHFFRSGVKPLWEDEANREGGCWVLKVRKADQKALRAWEELCLMVCGGELQAELSKGETCVCDEYYKC